MKNYTTSTPVFSDSIDIVETTDPAHADNVNAAPKQLLQNTLFNRDQISKLNDGLNECVNIEEVLNAIDEAYTQFTGYVNLKISELINGAPSTLDTLKEVADAIEENQDVVEALDVAIGSKASEKEFESHRTNGNIHVTVSEKERLAEIDSTYLRKDENVVKGAYYSRMGVGTTWDPTGKVMWYMGANKLDIEVIGDINVSAESVYQLAITWKTGERTATVKDKSNNSQKTVPVNTYYVDGYYCLDAFSAITMYGLTGVNRVYILSSGVFFVEAVAYSYNVIGNIKKQIGATPLGIGDGTLTGAISELNGSLAHNKITYDIIDDGTYDWRVYFENMIKVNNMAFVNFRLQSAKLHNYNNNTWLKVLQLSESPKSNIYGVVTNAKPISGVDIYEGFSIYIDTNGGVYLTPIESLSNYNCIIDCMFIFETK